MCLCVGPSVRDMTFLGTQNAKKYFFVFGSDKKNTFPEGVDAGKM